MLTNLETSCTLILDKTSQRAITALFITAATSVLLLSLPKKAIYLIQSISNATISKFGWLYIFFAIFISLWLLYLTFSKLGNVKLGTKVRFTNVKWISMLISVGVGPSIFYSSLLDWAHISPLLSTQHNDPIPVAVSYGILHWGPITWGICASLAVPMGIKKYNEKQSHTNISNYVLPKRYLNSPQANLFDSLSMFGLLCGASTTLTIGILLISTCMTELLNINNTVNIKTSVLFLISLCFGASSILGVNKGIARLSTLSITLSFLILVAVMIFGPTDKIVGNMSDIAYQTIKSSVYFVESLSPTSPDEVAKSWTIFYWAWWILYTPFMSLFIAKISEGRTVRQTILTTTICSSLGCGIFYLVLGGYSLELKENYELIAHELTQSEKLVTYIIGSLPYAKIWYILLAFCSSILLITTLDAISVALASSTATQSNGSMEPSYKGKLFWSFVITIIPFTIIYLNGDIALIKSIAIITSLPIMLLVSTGVINFLFKTRTDNEV